MKKKNYRLLAGSLVAILAYANAGSVALADEQGSRSVILRDGAKLSGAQGSKPGRPLALASADFDEDGVPDLIATYSGPQGGQVSVRRGNVDAIYPNSPEAQARKQNGQFTDAAFLAEPRSFALPEAADLIGAGDFDADGHWDIVGARTGSDKLFWLRGDGRGNFSKAQAIELHGTVTALVAGEMNRADGLTDVAVGFIASDGPRALVFESPEGALRAAPESFKLSAPASALALGQLDDDYTPDLAIASGNEVTIVHGRDRKLSLDAAHRADVKAAQLSQTALQSAITSLAVGDFAGDGRSELAASMADGKVRVLERRSDASGFQASDLMTLNATETTSANASSMRLQAAKVSSLPKDDLVIFGGSNDVRIVTTREADSFDGSGKVTKAGSARMRVAASLPSQSEAIAVLPMRLNVDALKDLVLLHKDSAAPSVMVTQPAATYVVNVTGNSSDVSPGNGVCLDNAGNCTFSAAIQEANAHTGADAIEFNIPGAGPHTVSPNFAQVFNDATTVDGTTQPGSRIEVIGNGILPFEFTGNSHNSVVRGVATYSFGQNAITIRTAGHIIEGNYIGLRADGSAPVGDRTNGGTAFFGGGNTLIGGTTAAARNVISNCNTAVLVTGGASANTIRGNYIGTNVAGTAAVPNTNEPIRDTQANGLTIGGTAAGAGNVISGNTDQGRGTISIENAISTGATLVQGNFIGTTADGMQPLSNSGTGISVGGSAGPVTIGGTTPAARNVISANGTGIVLNPRNAGGSDLVQGNFIGTNASGTGALPNLGPGVRMTGNSATLGGTASGAGNLISGNGGDGVLIGPEFLNTVQGNFIGTDVTGTVALPNFSDGVEIQANGFNGGRNNLIGGTSPEARNVISGNRENGIRYDSGGDAGPNRAEGNYIGVNRFGTGALGNGQHGVFLQGTPNNVGGSAPGAGNLIAFNGGDGIASSGGNFYGAILSNSIFSNAGLGIDLGNNGVTPFQGFTFGQYPVINSVSSTDSDTTVTGKLRTRTDGGNLPQTIQFFSSSSSDPSGHGEGQTFVGQTTISAGSNTEVPFSAVITPPVPPGRYISAVAVGQGETSNPNAIYSSEFSFCVRVAGENTPENTPLLLRLTTPNIGGNTGSVTTTIVGEGIQPGATVLLRRAGHCDIIGEGVVIGADGSFIRARFNLVGQAIGAWDVVVINPDGSTFTLPGVFMIEAGSEARIWTDLLGRGAMRPNQASRITILCGNLGNIDAYAVPLFLTGIPSDAIVTLSFNLIPVPITPQMPPGFDPNQIPPVVQNGSGQVLSIIIPAIPAGSVGTYALTIKVPSERTFALKVFASGPLLEAIGGPASGPCPNFGAGSADGTGIPPLRLAISQAGADCIQSILGNSVSCATSFIPGSDCFRATISSVNFINSIAQIITNTPSGDTGKGLSFAQLLGGAGSTALALGGCLGEVTPVGPLLDIVGCLLGGVTTIIDCAPAVVELIIDVIAARDPNEKTGSPGAGPGHHITGTVPMPYSIFFENQATATAPAQEVVVTDQLDGSKLNLDTFQLGPVSFGNDVVITPPPGLTQWTKDIDLRPDNNLIVRVIAGLDRPSGIVTWHFFSLDPATMQPTEDPLAGFLPPNQNPTEGDGALAFSIDPYPGQPFGTQINNQARIVFDTNPPINTPVWLNTIDNSLPVSSVSPLGATQSSRRFAVAWSGTDTGAGVKDYTIYVSENGAPFTVWLANIADTSATYDGRPNSTYAFYSIAKDGAGNREDAPASADASTETPSSPPVQLLSAASTKLHGNAGVFTIALPLTGNPGIECRSGVIDGDYTLVFTFANPLTRVDSASVTAGTGLVDGGLIGSDAHQYLAHVTGVATGQTLSIALHGAGDDNGNFSDSLPGGAMAVLVGDTTADGDVNASDISQAKAQIGASVTSGNFRNDVKTNGVINATDISLIKSQSGAP